MNEEQAAAKWIRTTLAAASGVTDLVSTRIHDTEAPQSATYPLIVFSMQAAADRKRPGVGGRMMSRALWLVKAVTSGSAESGYAAADAIYNALDAALVGETGNLTISGQEYAIQSVFRERGFRQMKTEPSVRYCSVGGVYRILVHASI